MPWFCVFVAVIGLGAIPLVAKAIRRRMTGVTAVEIDDSPLAMGQKTGIRVYQQGDYPIERFRVVLSCGTEHKPKGEVQNVQAKTLYSGDVVVATNLMASRTAPIREGELEIPANQGAPSAASEIWWRTWGLEVLTTITGKPDIVEVFTLHVVGPKQR